MCEPLPGVSSHLTLLPHTVLSLHDALYPQTVSQNNPAFSQPYLSDVPS